MDFLVEIAGAIMLVGVPVGLFTLAMVWWALRSGHLEASDESKSLERQIKTLPKSKPEAASKPQSLLQKKWAKFGGGFYGIVAFLTYIVVESTEILTTVANFGGLADFLRQIDIGVVIDILVEGLSNFISAMIWPLYWVKRIEPQTTWLWFVVAYAGYWLGIKAAHQLSRR